MESFILNSIGLLVMVLALGLPILFIGAIALVSILYFQYHEHHLHNVIPMVIISQGITLLLTAALYALVFKDLPLLIGKVMIPATIIEIIVIPATLLFKGYDISKILPSY